MPTERHRVIVCLTARHLSCRPIIFMIATPQEIETMKTYTFTGSTALALVATLVTSSASAVSSGNPIADVMSAVGSGGQVNVCIDGSTATLSGHVENAMVAEAARRAVLEDGGIDTVVDLIHRG